MIEIWKDIKGYEGLYQVSNLGNVKSLERYVTAPQNGGKRLLKEKSLKQSISKTGYYVVALSKNHVAMTKKVHRLIAEAFIPNLLDKPHINHIDGNKLNNDIINLEWATHKENTQHAFRIGIMNNDRNNKSTYCLELDLTLTSRSNMAEHLINNNFIPQKNKSRVVGGICKAINGKLKSYYGLHFSNE